MSLRSPLECLEAGSNPWVTLLTTVFLVSGGHGFLKEQIE